MIVLAVLAALLFSVLAASIVLNVLRFRAAEKVPVEGLPMVPNPHWLFGHFRTFVSPAGFEANQRNLCLDHANSSGISTFWILNARWVSVTRPDDVRRVLTAAHNRKPMAFQAHHGSHFIGRRSITFLRGKEWRYYRSAMHRSFTPAALAGMRRPMADVASTLVGSLKRRIQDSESSSKAGSIITMDVESLLKMVTMDTFGKAALDLDFGCCANLAPSPVATAFDFLSDELVRRFKTFYLPSSHFYGLPTEANRRHRRDKRLIRGVLKEAIQSRLEGEGWKRLGGGSDGAGTRTSNNDDLLSHLLRAKANEADVQSNESNSQSSPVGRTKQELSEETFSDILMTLLFAGYETTSVTLSYALHCLATHPKAEARVVEEVNKVLGPSPPSEGVGAGGPLPLLDPETLPYCNAVIMETLRLYSPAINTTRTLESPLEMGGCTVPAGTQVFIPIWLIQRDGRNFPRPLEFVPERWVCRDGSGSWRERCADDDGDGGGEGGGDEECNGETGTTGASSGSGGGCHTIPAANRNAFFAFSGGARSCVGQKFALQEAVTILSVLVRDLEFKCIDGYVLEPHRPGIVQKPRGGMPMGISERH